MKRWFCPEHFTVSQAEIDFRPGRVCRICMRSPAGQKFWSKGNYIEITPPNRLVFTLRIADGDAQRFTALNSVTFEEDGAGTHMSVDQSHDVHDASGRPAIEGVREGWRTTLDKLDEEVARIRAARPSLVHSAFSVERTFDASPAKVFHALLDATAKARWFNGGEGFEEPEREMDARPGGRERLRGRWANGMVSTFDAVNHDVIQDERLVYASTMTLDARKISVSLATVLLQAGSGTRMIVTEQGAFLDGYDDAGSRARQRCTLGSTRCSPPGLTRKRIGHRQPLFRDEYRCLSNTTHRAARCYRKPSHLSRRRQPGCAGPLAQNA
jgi:uncharacterized protein YndB with AHSA1/START domain